VKGKVSRGNQLLTAMKFFSIFIGFALLLHGGSIQAAEMPSNQTSENQFERIEQPLALKAIVTVGGVALIGLELWWFLFSKRGVNGDKQ